MEVALTKDHGTEAIDVQRVQGRPACQPYLDRLPRRLVYSGQTGRQSGSIVGNYEIVSVGVLNPSQFKDHPHSTTVDDAAMREAAEAWTAATNPEPEKLLAILTARERSLPFLKRSLFGLLYRYPDLRTGLNAWEYQLLRYVREDGPKAVRVVGSTIAHDLEVALKPFAIRRTAVTNAEFLAFVRLTGYRPADGERFLAHVARTPAGALPAALPDEQGALPVTFVSLADARAYAAAQGERLPTEAEWQWAAEGAGRGLRYPWGSDERTFAPGLRPALDPTTATPQGVMGLSGNAWELTESEYSDGHTRFVMLRGGSYQPPSSSECGSRGRRGRRPSASANPRTWSVCITGACGTFRWRNSTSSLSTARAGCSARS